MRWQQAGVAAAVAWRRLAAAAAVSGDGSRWTPADRQDLAQTLQGLARAEQGKLSGLLVR